MKNLLSISDLTRIEIEKLLALTQDIKQKAKKGSRYQPLLGKTLAMIFEKPSTRTRVSFEVGMTQLGGHAIFLSSDDIQLKRGETLADTAKTLSRFVDGIMIRANKHNSIVELAKHSVVPIINGLSDMEHPCQVLGDIFTIIEQKLIKSKGKIDINKFKELRNLKVTYLGDGNNIANSLLFSASILGMRFTISTPQEYALNKEIFDKSLAFAKLSGAVIELTSDPQEAVKYSDVIYTDVWTSMGQENESTKRKQIFEKYRVDKALISKAKTDVSIMHCLPAHRGEEITDEVIDGPNSIVFDQAENRLHIEKAILVELLGKQ